MSRLATGHRRRRHQHRRRRGGRRWCRPGQPEGTHHARSDGRHPGSPRGRPARDRHCRSSARPCWARPIRPTPSSSARASSAWASCGSRRHRRSRCGRARPGRRSCVDAILGPTEIIKGGFEYDGREIAPLDEDAVRRFAHLCVGKVSAIAISCAFSPAIVRPRGSVPRRSSRAELGDSMAVTKSYEIGSLGLLEREDAAALNASLLGVSHAVVHGLAQALTDNGLDVGVVPDPERRHAHDRGPGRQVPGPHGGIRPHQLDAWRQRPRRAHRRAGHRRRRHIAPTWASSSTASRASRRTRSRSAACAPTSACRTSSPSASAAARSSMPRALA